MVKKKLWLNSLILLWYLVPSPMKISEIQMPTHVGDAVEALVGMFAAALAWFEWQFQFLSAGFVDGSSKDAHNSVLIEAR